jgi:AbiV family abortive infection protein
VFIEGESVPNAGHMGNYEYVNKAFRSCLKNAEEHLAAAKTLREAGHNNMAFNAAVLALEEVGKAILIAMSRAPSRSNEPDHIRSNWLDDHAKKLFGVLWSTTFGQGTDTIQDFQQFPPRGKPNPPASSERHLRRPKNSRVTGANTG